MPSTVNKSNSWSSSTSLLIVLIRLISVVFSVEHYISTCNKPDRFFHLIRAQCRLEIKSTIAFHWTILSKQNFKRPKLRYKFEMSLQSIHRIFRIYPKQTRAMNIQYLNTNRVTIRETIPNRTFISRLPIQS